MRFGLCADIRNVLEVQAAGYDYIEGKLNQFALWSDEEFESVLELFRSAEIKMETVSLLLPKSMTVIGDKFSKVELLTYLDRAFARMDALDSKLVVFGSGKSRFVPEGMRWQDAFTELVKVTGLMGNIAAEHGISIAIEPLNRSETNLINSLAEGAALQAAVGRDNVGLLADGFHMRREGEDMNRIVLCSPLMHTHIAMKDGRAYPTERCEETEEFFTMLKAAGYDGRMSIEGKSDDWKSDSEKALSVLRSYN